MDNKKCPACGFSRTDKRHGPKCSAKLKAAGFKFPPEKPKKAGPIPDIKVLYCGHWRQS